MRRLIRPATPEEEALVSNHINPAGETLLGVHKDQSMYAIRQADGGLRFIDYNSVKPNLAQRAKRFVGL